MVPLGLAGEPTTTPLSGLVAMLGEQRFAGHRPARRRARFDPHRLAAQRREDVAVGRIARQRDGDAIAGFEGGEKGENEAGRRAGRDDDPRRIEVDPVPFAIGQRDAPPQRCHPERFGIAEPRGARALRAPRRWPLPARPRPAGRLPYG